MKKILEIKKIEGLSYYTKKSMLDNCSFNKNRITFKKSMLIICDNKGFTHINKGDYIDLVNNLLYIHQNENFIGGN